jgi:hypothetical protein
MTAWTSDELNRIGEADELRIASRRRDGTLRKPVIIWVVRVGDDLYVRSGFGHTAAWFRGTQVLHEGRISAGGIEKEVVFASAGAASNDQIDEAYNAKYHHHGAEYVESVTTEEARLTTIRLVPR